VLTGFGFGPPLIFVAFATSVPRLFFGLVAYTCRLVRPSWLDCVGGHAAAACLLAVVSSRLILIQQAAGWLTSVCTCALAAGTCIS